MTVGILDIGAYIPRNRLQRSAIYRINAWFAPGLKGLARGARAIAGWDEDPITLAVQAARIMLGQADRSAICSLSLASTTMPFADRLNAGIVKEALNLDDRTLALDLSGSLRCATSGLIQAFAASAADRGQHLALAADMVSSAPASDAELSNGDAAAAILIGDGEPIATLSGSFTITADFVDHFRMSGVETDYGWESRWVRDEGYLGIMGGGVAEALKAFGVEAAAIDSLIIPITVRKVAEDIAARVGIRPEAVADRLADQVGCAGAAHPFLLLASALEKAKPGQKLLLVGFGQGVDVLLFETTAAIALWQSQPVTRQLERGVADENYARWLFHRGQLKLHKGMRAELDEKQPGTTLWRNRKAVMALVGGRCTETGVVQFPKSEISVNPNNHSLRKQEDYPLADRTARILTYTADNLTYSPNPPNYYGMIDFEGGGRMIAEFADVTEADVAVGAEMEMVFRIKAFDEKRSFVRYFWKATPRIITEKNNG
jgi:3-hydroxy-3-methylglutaryl CoA synthase